MTIRIDFLSGVESTTIPEIAGEPATAGDLISKSYAEKNFTQGLETLTELKAIVISDPETQTVFVRETGSFYVFDPSSVDAGDDSGIIEPDSGTGRWVRTGLAGLSLPESGVILTEDSTNTLSNKSIDANTNPITNLDNANFKTGAQIARAKVQLGTANHVLINAGTGALSSEAALSKVRGGTGQDNSGLTFPTTGTLATLGGAESLTNKSLDAPKFLTYLDLTEVSAPTAPGAGYNRVYAKSDGKLYRKNNANVESELGAGGGGGSGEGAKNYVTNTDETNLTTGFSLTGANLTFTVQSTNVLGGAFSYRLSKAAVNATGQYLSYPFTLERRHQGRSMRVSFAYQPTTNFADGDLKVQIWDVTNSVMIEPAPTTVQKVGLNWDFMGEFQAPTNSTSFQLRLVVSSTNALAWDLDLDSIFVGPGTAPSVGGFVGNWTPYPTPPTIQGFGTLTVNNWYWKQEGGDLLLRGNITIGTPSAVEAQIPLPSGLVSSSTYAGITLVGEVARQQSFGATAVAIFTAIEPSKSYFVITATRGDTSWQVFQKRNGSDLCSVGDSFTFTARIQIQGWNSAMVLSSESSTRVITASATGTPTGTLGAAWNQVTMPTILKDDIGGFSSGTYVIKVPGMYQFTGQVRVYGTFAASNIIGVRFTKNGTLDANSIGSKNVVFYGGTDQVGDVITAPIECFVGDVVRMMVFCNAGSPTYSPDSNYQRFGVVRIAGPAQVAASEKIAFSANTSNTSCTNNTQTTVVFTNVLANTHSAYNAGIFTAPRSGLFDIKSCVTFASAGTAFDVFGLIYVNSTEICRYQGRAPTSVGGAPCPLGIDAVPLNAGDTVQIKAMQVSGGTLALLNGAAGYCYFSVASRG